MILASQGNHRDGVANFEVDFPASPVRLSRISATNCYFHRPLPTTALSFKSDTVTPSQNGTHCPAPRTQLKLHQLIAQQQAGQTTLYKHVTPESTTGDCERKANRMI